MAGNVLRAYKSEADPILVCRNSPENYRKSVERFARYFLREMNFDFIQYEAEENFLFPGYKPYHAYLFHNRTRFLGACCFRFNELATPSWCLDWVWLHPFARRNGHLKNTWPLFCEKYGRFNISEPLSDGMKNFLHKINHCDKGLTGDGVILSNLTL